MGFARNFREGSPLRAAGQALRVTAVALAGAWNLGAGPAAAISEQNFVADYASLVLPYYEAGSGGSFISEQGVRLSFRVFNRGAASPAIVLLPGYSESYRKYAELIFDLGSRGYSIYTMDPRGQGASQRLTPLHDLGHVDDFENYVRDLDTFVTRFVLPGHHPRLFLLAHSMGAAIAARYLPDHPRVFDAVVFSSPMFRINTGDTDETFAYFGSWWKTVTGKAEQPVDGLDRYGYAGEATVDQSRVTSSPPRWHLSEQIIRDDPALAMGGVSYGWLFQALIATAGIERMANLLQVPVVILKAGGDAIVKTDSDDWYCGQSRVPCTVISAPFKDAKHEILQERDAMRDPAIAAIAAILAAFR